MPNRPPRRSRPAACRGGHALLPAEERECQGPQHEPSLPTACVEVADAQYPSMRSPGPAVHAHRAPASSRLNSARVSLVGYSTRSSKTTPWSSTWCPGGRRSHSGADFTAPPALHRLGRAHRPSPHPRSQLPRAARVQPEQLFSSARASTRSYPLFAPKAYSVTPALARTARTARAARTARTARAVRTGCTGHRDSAPPRASPHHWGPRPRHPPSLGAACSCPPRTGCRVRAHAPEPVP